MLAGQVPVLCLSRNASAPDRETPAYHVVNTVPQGYHFDMTILAELLAVAGEQRGFVTVSDARTVKVNPVELRKLAAKGHLEHRGHGLYRFATFPAATHDDLMEAALWADGAGVVSHESALMLWNLCDANPRRIHVTVPRRIRRQNPAGYRVYLSVLGPTDRDWVAGIPVTTPARTILDAAATGTDPQLIEQAIASAVRLQLVSEADAQNLRERTSVLSGGS
jgi:predicted transcriptional regulator of viral defense system